ncbi:hypothetical protein [Flavobacterium stagni]|uniref:Uncharacterized protein n=1 Tax=Flavobacterium stagni TaxID=2506421 RepID=A0A4Q1KDN2_9FLAO|nr:hypothetical protein [Flavobacterium stagni]RXR24679.1 hypothetical protein EQG61_04325 [Flavobacterium stagni]
MSKEYIYNNFIWKGIFGNINSNKIYPRFNKGEQFSIGFSNIVRYCVALPKWTIKNSETKLYLSIKDNGEVFEFTSNWISTKMKGAFLETIFDEIVNRNKTENEYVNWRSDLFNSLLELKEKATDLRLSKSSEDKIELNFKVHLNKLQATFEPVEFLDPFFIIELGSKSSLEVCEIGLDFLEVDNKKCIGILKTIIDEIPYVGLIIGIAYFFEGKSELSNNYIITALNQVDSIDFSIDFTGLIAEVIATNDYNLGVVDDKTIRMFFNVLDINQSTTALIKLSYIILNKNLKYLKEFALENVAIAINHNLNDKNESTKISGFHIICSVLLWNDKFNEAEKYHHYFLNEKNDFLKYNFEHVEGYITLALAKNNHNFISNLILDFPHLKNRASGLFNAWSFENLELKNKSWSNLDIYNHNKIINARKLYCE